jgi:hypothetical protein
MATQLIGEFQEGVEVHVLPHNLVAVPLQDRNTYIQMQVLRQIMGPQHLPQSHCFLVFKFPEDLANHSEKNKEMITPPFLSSPAVREHSFYILILRV